MAQDNKPRIAEETPDIKQLRKRVDVLDQRLDNIDSMVTAIAEGLNKPVIFTVTCPHCGKEIEVALVGGQKIRN